VACASLAFGDDTAPALLRSYYAVSVEVAVRTAHLLVCGHCLGLWLRMTVALAARAVQALVTLAGLLQVLAEPLPVLPALLAASL
jgi:hypothetical protein